MRGDSNTIVKQGVIMGEAMKVVNFRCEPSRWANYERVAATMGIEPAVLLRELIAHADSAYRAIKAGQIASLDGDVSSWLTKEFPKLPPGELRLFAAILASAADKIETGSGIRG